VNEDQESRVSGDGCTIAFRVDGAEDAPALLLSNALGTNLNMWAPQVAAFAAHFLVIRYDTRGHGQSDAPRNPYTIDQLGRDALAVLDAANVSRAHVCGLSLGGVTAMWLAVNAPLRVAALVLAATAGRIGAREMWETRIEQVLAGGTESIADAVMTRWFTEEFRASSPSLVETYRSMLTSTPRDGYIGCSAALRDADLRHTIERITAPTLVVAGTADAATPPTDAEEIRLRVPGAAMQTLNGSHLINVEQPDAFNRAVLTFIGQQQHPAQARASHG
jgi:3-oxoadipate enol-lactonase